MAPFIEEPSNVGNGIPQPTSNPELDGNALAEPIAIIGFSFKFPDDADTPDGFWKMLMEQRNAARDFPADRINVNGHYRKENRHNSVSQFVMVFTSFPTRGNFWKERSQFTNQVLHLYSYQCAEAIS
jgi:hypothetical protein